MTIRYTESGLDADVFIALAQRVWPREWYDVTLTAEALKRTGNIGAWDDARLVGTVRILTDGYFFATIPEILVDPDYQRRGIGRELMFRALEMAPRGRVFFGAQAESLSFFEKIGCESGPMGMVLKRPATPAT